MSSLSPSPSPSPSPSSYYDVIIIGSGMAGLYAALKVRKLAPQLSFLVVEKYDTYGGKSYNEDFENTSVVTGAGIGRLHKDKLLLNLMRKFKIPIHTFETGHNFIASLEPICHVKTTFMELKHTYNKMHPRTEASHTTFKKFATSVLGKKEYDKFIMCAGYSDYENEDAYDVLYHYNFDDNYNRWMGFSVPWKTLVDKIVHSLKSGQHIINNTEVTRITKYDNAYFEITTKHPHDQTNRHQSQSKKKYYCEKVVVATDIDGIKELIQYNSSIPEAVSKLYSQIKGQPFLRLYAKFSRESIPYLKEKIQGVTIIPGPMQKVIPMDPDHGVYMIIYSDNADADFFKKYFKNNQKNRNILNTMLENATDLKGKLRIENIKDFYWKNGTHYYTPLTDEFDTRQQFIKKTQHPEQNVLVVGEVISLHQGWVEGALESVEQTLTKKWLLA